MTLFRRPLGEISTCILSLAREQGITYHTAATTLQLSRRHASVTVHDLARAGHLVEVSRCAVPGARKPVPVYRAAVHETAPECPALLVFEWPRVV
jgi:hypothetical protein